MSMHCWVEKDPNNIRKIGETDIKTIKWEKYIYPNNLVPSNKMATKIKLTLYHFKKTVHSQTYQ